MTNFGGIYTKTKQQGGRGLGYAGVSSALLLNLGMKNWRKEIVCIMRVCDRGGEIPVVCLSVCVCVCNLSPPRCLHHSA